MATFELKRVSDTRLVIKKNEYGNSVHMAVDVKDIQALTDKLKFVLYSSNATTHD